MGTPAAHGKTEIVLSLIFRYGWAMKTKLIILVVMQIGFWYLECTNAYIRHEYGSIPLSVIRNVDSLKINILMEDFIAQGISRDNNSFFLHYSLVNKSSKPITIYWPAYPGYYRPETAENLGILIGKDSITLNDRVMVMTNRFLCDTCFKVIQPHDSMSYRDSLDLFEYIQRVAKAADGKLIPGDYWVQLVYKNTLYRLTDIDSWAGEIKSDTIWFEIY